MTNTLKKDVLAEIRNHAEMKAGACISPKYTTIHAALRWRCSFGHEWLASWANVRRGSWCPTCSKRPSISLKDVQFLARLLGGSLLSPKYINAHQKLFWSCRKGHHWRATYSNVKLGSWCPKCSIGTRFSLADLQRIAREHAGRLISKKCSSKSEPLRWECEKGHLFFLSAATIIKGAWCVECSQLAGDKSLPGRRREFINILLASPDYKPKIDLNSIIFEFENADWPIDPLTVAVFETYVELTCSAFSDIDSWEEDSSNAEAKYSRNRDFLSSVTFEFLQGFDAKYIDSDSDGQWETLWAKMRFQDYEARAIFQILENLRLKKAPKSF